MSFVTIRFFKHIFRTYLSDIFSIEQQNNNDGEVFFLTRTKRNLLKLDRNRFGLEFFVFDCFGIGFDKLDQFSDLLFYYFVSEK